jgi:uncharacterized protein (DUF1501 family)
MVERTVVVVFLRGGADGLSLVAPVHDDDYQRARPTLAVKPGSGHRLDDRFTLHPRLAALGPWFDAGKLSVIHACGSDDETRSHFYAQDLMDHGGTTVAGGWLGRYLRQLQGRGGLGFLEAVTIGSAVGECLRGAPTASAFTSLADLHGDADDRRLFASLGALSTSDALLGIPAQVALSASARLDALRQAADHPANGASYPSATQHGEIAASFGARMRLVARLIQSGVGLKAACVDLDGWDSHFIQNTVLPARLTALGQGLSAFATYLGSDLDQVSVVVISEFGRRVSENTSLGTDHGRGGAAFVLGGGTSGGVHCRWPGLASTALEGPGDLSVVHDYRDVLWPVLQRHGVSEAATIFPGFSPRPLPV